MLALINVVLPVFAVAGLAALLQPYLKLHRESLSQVSFYLFVPALTFVALVESEVVLKEFGLLALGATLLAAALLILGELAGRVLHLELPTRGAFVATLALANVGTYGLPVITFAVGDEGLVPATLYVIVFNALLLTLVGIYLALIGQGRVKSALRRLAGAPIVYAALLGFAVRLADVRVPEPLLKALTLLSQAAIPALLLVLGLQLREGSREGAWGRHAPALVALVAGRLIVAPLLALAVAHLMGLEGAFRAAFVIDGGVPSAMLAAVLAEEFDFDATFATLGIFATMVVSLVTVPALVALTNG
jgi:hypothetical protein